jgi:DMSO/TMAO reductase YedYZ heme-binding membrane subunit
VKGWKIVGVSTLFLLVAFGSIVSLYGTGEQGLGVLLRASARLSFLFFLPVYLASSARRLWPSDTTRWLLRNRRYLGLSFFVAHGLHLDAIFLMDTLQGDAFRIELPTLLAGGLAYLLVTAMAATSSDRAVKWLGRQRWSRLHRFGIHYIWFIWLLQWTPLALTSPGYAALLLLTLAALGVRIAARRSRAAQPAPAPAAS